MERIAGLTGIDIKAGIAQDGPEEFRTFVKVFATGEDEGGEIVLRGQISIDKLREMAIQWIQIAAAAEQDRITLLMLIRDIGVSPISAAEFVNGMREEREGASKPENPEIEEKTMYDFRIQGSEEDQQKARGLVSSYPQCTTALQGTGSKCTCPEACGNYVLRANGFRAEDKPEGGEA
jgi:hypothetical protein